MNEYLQRIVFISIFVSIVRILSPKYKSVDRYIKMICSLIILCVIISPIITLIQKFNLDDLEELKGEIQIDENENGDKYRDILNEYISNHSINELKREVKNILKREFDVPEDECEMIIKTTNDDGELILQSITVLLSGKSIFKNPYTIEDYLSNLLKCECQVKIKN